MALAAAAAVALGAGAGAAQAAVIAGGYSHSLALRRDGTVAAWGYNNRGQTSVPPGLNNAVAVAGGRGSHSLALRSDGTVAAWGYNGYGETNVPAELNTAVAVAGGGFHSLALKSDGTVAAWGRNNDDQTNVPTGLSTAVAVAGGLFHSLALRSDGTVAAWGNNLYGQTNVPAELDNAVAVAGGGFHSVALKNDGTVAAWGLNNFGQTSVPADLNTAVAVAGGAEHSLALKSDGTVAAWGFNGGGQSSVPAGLDNAVAVAAGGHHSLALRSDGTIIGWGDNSYGQTTAPAGLIAPYTAIWSNPSGGLFLGGHNWKHGTPSTAAADAVFDLNSTYAVNFTSDSRAKTLHVNGGDVTLDLEGRALDVAGNLSAGELGGKTGSLTLTGGGDVTVGTRFQSGVSGTGAVVVTGGTQVTAGTHVVLADNSGAKGTMTVTGPGSRVSALNEVGIGGGGSHLKVLDGGEVVAGTDFGTGGRFTGDTSFATVRSDTADVSRLRVTNAINHRLGVMSIETGGEVSAGGATTISAEATLNLAGGTLRTGSLDTQGSASRFNWTGGDLELTSNLTHNVGGLTVPNGSRLTGLGYIPGSVINDGELAPGNSPGTLGIDNYQQRDSGSLLIELASATDYDRLEVSEATLDGTLTVDLLDGFTPEDGDVFTIMTTYSLAGTFDGMPDGTVFTADGHDFRIDYNNEWTGTVAPDTVTLTAVPEPAGLGLLALGALGLLRRRRSSRLA